jgi:hypothetical protein
MMNPNPEESRKIAEEQMKLMGKPNFSEEMKKPGKNGPSLDSELRTGRRNLKSTNSRVNCQKLLECAGYGCNATEIMISKSPFRTLCRITTTDRQPDSFIRGT